MTKRAGSDFAMQTRLPEGTSSRVLTRNPEQEILSSVNLSRIEYTLPYPVHELKCIPLNTKDTSTSPELPVRIDDYVRRAVQSAL